MLGGEKSPPVCPHDCAGPAGRGKNGRLTVCRLPPASGWLGSCARRVLCGREECVQRGIFRNSDESEAGPCHIRPQTIQLPTLGKVNRLPGRHCRPPADAPAACLTMVTVTWEGYCLDRKSTRLNSSHTVISYAV